MVKKFISYFLVIFLISFLILNSRFVLAQVRFAFFGSVDKELAVLPRDTNLPTVGPAKKLTAVSPSPIVKPADGFVLQIPEVGVTAPVVLEKSINPNVIFDRLEDGVVHFANSPLPGESGTAVILGHSSAYPWYKGHYGSIFALLGRLKIGDTFYVKNGDTVLTYKISGILVFNPLSKDNRIDQLENTKGSAIILVSCWPVGTNYQRIAVRADLI